MQNFKLKKVKMLRRFLICLNFPNIRSGREILLSSFHAYVRRVVSFGSLVGRDKILSKYVSFLGVKKKN